MAARFTDLGGGTFYDSTTKQQVTAQQKQIAEMQSAGAGPKLGSTDPNASPVTPVITAAQRGPIGFDEGVARGTRLADQFLGPDAQATAQSQRSSEINDVIARRKAALGGLDSDENRAMADSANKEIQQSTQGALRSMRGSLAANGIHGGAAVAAQAGVEGQGTQQLAAAERQRLLDNVAAKRDALQSYQDAITGQEGVEQNQLRDKARVAIGVGSIGQNAVTLADTLSSNTAGAKAQADANASGGLSTLCTALYMQGGLPHNIWVADSNYGEYHISRDTIRGYHSWGRPIANLMLKSPRLTRVLSPLIRAWAYHMAYKMGQFDRPNLMGAALLKVGAPLCAVLGKVSVRRGR